MADQDTRSRRAELGQFFTPFWAAEWLIQHYFQFSLNDVVVEPTCGDGSFLCAIPKAIEAVGIEIDPDLAASAARTSGRRVICGDIRTVNLDIMPTVAVGNVPFKIELFQVILDRLKVWMPKDGRCGFVVPSYFFQSSSTALGYAEGWNIRTEHIPREIFPRLTKPLVFALFERARHGRLIGFALYEEMNAINQMAGRYRELLARSDNSVWKKVVIEAFAELGGVASLKDLYEVIAPKRPTHNKWWQPKIRQIVQEIGQRISRGRYSLGEQYIMNRSIQFRLAV
jgi:hypothetical protein